MSHPPECLSKGIITVLANNKPDATAMAEEEAIRLRGSGRAIAAERMPKHKPEGNRQA